MLTDRESIIPCLGSILAEVDRLNILALGVNINMGTFTPWILLNL
jgi:hypothetical protein